MSVIATGLILCACSPYETFKESYANMDEARADGAVQRGWIPDWLPDDVYNIEEEHNVDRNDGWISFNWSGELQDLGPGCEQTSPRGDQATCPGFNVQSYQGRVVMIRKPADD